MVKIIGGICVMLKVFRDVTIQMRRRKEKHWSKAVLLDLHVQNSIFTKAISRNFAFVADSLIY